MCHQNTHTALFTDIFLSYSPTNKVRWGRKTPARPTAPLAAALEHLSHEIWHWMWCWHWHVRNWIFKHNSELSSPSAPQAKMSPEQNPSSEGLQVLRVTWISCEQIQTMAITNHHKTWLCDRLCSQEPGGGTGSFPWPWQLQFLWFWCRD